MLKYLRMGSKRTKAIWWALIVITVVTFVGGFIFLFGAGLDSTQRAQASGALGVVDGSPITAAEYQYAVLQQREVYKRQYGSDPVDQDARMLESQAWRTLVVQRLLDKQARKLGLKAYDKEVLLQLQTSPPQELLMDPNFQTDGKFDQQKYAQALRNPGYNWSAYEALVRTQLPTRKLQERLLASLKLSQGELQEAFRNRYERVEATVVMVPPVSDAKLAPPTDADLDRTYEKYKSRFMTGPRMMLEVLQVPKAYSDEELRVAREQAASLAERARRGEDFATLARDYSEGPGATRGGEIQRVFQPAEFGPINGPKLAALPKDGVSDPIQDGGRYMIFKILDRIGDPLSPTPNLRVAQIVIKAQPSEVALREQLEKVRKLRARAASIGLGKAAAEQGMATSRTGWVDLNAAPPQLAGAPEALDWALGAKKGAVSPVFQELEAFVVAQLVDRRPAGTAPKSDVIEQLRQVAELEARAAAAKPKMDQVAAALSQGRTLEQAATAAGVTPFTVSMTRQQPHPTLAGAPEVLGGLFGSAPGKVIGPVQTPGGWYLARVDQKTPPDSTTFNDNQVKGQLTTDILTRKQQQFFTTWLGDLRRGAKVKDLRSQ
jgi:peptidyl-prolyl cis-trans isomerase D